MLRTERGKVSACAVRTGASADVKITALHLKADLSQVSGNAALCFERKLLVRKGKGCWCEKFQSKKENAAG